LPALWTSQGLCADGTAGQGRREMDAFTESVYEFGSFRVDTDSRQLLKDGQPVALAPKAFDLLCYLLAHPHRLLAKDELLKGV